MGRELANCELMVQMHSLLIGTEAAAALDYSEPRTVEATDAWFNAQCDKLAARYGSLHPWTLPMKRLSEAMKNRFVDSDGTSIRHQREYIARLTAPVTGELERAMAKSDVASTRAADRAAAARRPVCTDAKRSIPWQEAWMYYHLMWRTIPKAMQNELDENLVRSIRGLLECLEQNDRFSSYPTLERLVREVDEQRAAASDRAAAHAAAGGAGGGKRRDRGKKGGRARRRGRGGGAGAGAPRQRFEEPFAG